MKLISAHIRGYGRIVDSKVNLDAKVIAIVGPNEAGKSTLLKALSHVDTQSAVPAAERSRAVDVSDDTPITTFDYVVEPEDHGALEDLDLHEMPTRARISRSASGGKLVVALTPSPVKAVKSLVLALTKLRDAASQADLDSWIDPESTYSDPESDDARDYRSELQILIEAIESSVAEPGTAMSEDVVDLARSLLSVTLEGDVASKPLRDAYNAAIAWAERADPAPEARNRIWNGTPDFILFDEADRSIMSSYTFDEALVDKVPPALANLAGTASLDLRELLGFYRSGDVARRRTAIAKANARMDQIFADAWKQSKLSVHLELDGDQLRVELMEDGDNVTVFDERSAGLRMFVALIAFLKVHGGDRPPILLIDEAENHLHIDAQADLVNMFVTQEHAVKVIYTTHSPACLPPDLGTGIRVVVPREDNLQVSEVKNNFWMGTAGFSPLMMAMGAAAAAFTPARFVVLGEGATEMILLPTLLREATGQDELPYQVAPGLSEVPNDFLPKLDLEAARVAYLVDGDAGGAQLKENLAAAGVPDDLIVDLGLPGIENVLEPERYRAAITALLRGCNPDVKPADIPTVPDAKVPADESIAAHIDSWVQAQGLKVPSKVAVANWLVESWSASDKQSTLSDAGKTTLVALDLRLRAALKIEDETRDSNAID